MIKCRYRILLWLLILIFVIYTVNYIVGAPDPELDKFAMGALYWLFVWLYMLIAPLFIVFTICNFLQIRLRRRSREVGESQENEKEPE